MNYRRIRRYIQKKVKNTFEKNGLLEKYRTREKRRVEDIVKKVTATLVETARVYSADIVRENLRDMKMNSKKVSRKMNYRLQTFPYRKIISNIDYKACERGSNVIEADAKRSLITCSPCRSVDKRNRVDSKYKCKKRGFSLNLHYVACLNLFSHLNDGEIAIRGGRNVPNPKGGLSGVRQFSPQ
ncbi:MAG: IS200/IS605 family accessory protein TnpB-related protein [Acidilobaceae archaeon]